MNYGFVRRSLYLSVALGSLLVSACSSALIFATYTDIGVSIHAGKDSQWSAKVGMSRVEGVTIPLRKYPLDKGKDGGQILEKAYPVLSLFEFDSGGLLPENILNGRALEVRQQFMTGAAALQDNSALNMLTTYKGNIMPPDEARMTGALMKSLNALSNPTSGDKTKLAQLTGIISTYLGDGTELALSAAKSKIREAGQSAELQPKLQKVYDEAHKSGLVE